MRYSLYVWVFSKDLILELLILRGVRVRIFTVAIISTGLTGKLLIIQGMFFRQRCHFSCSTVVGRTHRIRMGTIAERSIQKARKTVVVAFFRKMAAHCFCHCVICSNRRVDKGEPGQ